MFTLKSCMINEMFNFNLELAYILFIMLLLIAMGNSRKYVGAYIENSFSKFPATYFLLKNVHMSMENENYKINFKNLH